MLNISKLMRTDAGIYSCEAVNSQGSAVINITVIVECKCISILTECVCVPTCRSVGSCWRK